jgi:hypothetical protein
MPELIIKYKNKKTLEALKDFAKYFEFSVVTPQVISKGKTSKSKAVKIIPADSTIDTSELETIFSNKNLDAKQLREDAWLRNK